MPDKDRFRYQRVDGNRLTIERRGLADAIARVHVTEAGLVTCEVSHCDEVIERFEGAALSVEKAVRFAEDELEYLWRDDIMNREMTHVDAFFVRHGLGD